MKRIISICVASAIVLSGCNTLNYKERKQMFTTENNTFIGKTYDDLIKGKGVPSGTASLTDTGKVVEYYNSQLEVTGGGYYGYPHMNYGVHAYGGRNMFYGDYAQSFPVQTWLSVCKIDFVVSSKNVVESWKFDGMGCF
jgi:hypothetical protein